MSEARSFDPMWEEKYAAGHSQRYPWDAVVSFVFRHAPRDRPRGEVRILEVGCGTASNLWFAAREGFAVAGVDASASAIRTAQERFRDEGLQADLRTADFTALPFADRTFDLALDRAALSCCGRSAARRAIGELARVLRPGGQLLFMPYSSGHSSRASGKPGLDELVLGISAGTLVGAGQICFWSEDDIRAAFARGWMVEKLEHVEAREHIDRAQGVHAEWRCVARRTDD
jgi:SAM-dependent methyltransferase